MAHDGELELVSVESGRMTPVRTFPLGELVRYPTWSPDGGRLAFTVLGSTFNTPRALYTVARDGSDLTRIAEGIPKAIGPWVPSWSPDGSRIAYLDSTRWDRKKGWKLHVTVVDPDGTAPSVLVQAGRCFCLGVQPRAGLVAGRRAPRARDPRSRA